MKSQVSTIFLSI